MPTLRLSAIVAILAIAGMQLAACSRSGDGTLGGQSVGEVLKSEDAALNKGDSKQAYQLLSDDCVLLTTFPAREGNPASTNKVSCKQYVDTNQQNLQEGMGEKYQSTSPAITVEGDKAHAHRTSTLTATMAGGRAIVDVSDERDTLEVRGGHLLITAIDKTNTSETDSGATAPSAGSASSPNK